MRVRPIHFVPDLADAVRCYEVLGLRSQARSRSGHWIELAATEGEVGLHDAAVAADGQGPTGIALNLVADEPWRRSSSGYGKLAFRLTARTLTKSESLFARGSDGTVIQIEEQDPELYT